MPRTKSSAFTGSADVEAMIERVAPAILALLADGVPRTKLGFGCSRGPASDEQKALEEAGGNSRALQAGP